MPSVGRLLCLALGLTMFAATGAFAKTQARTPITVGWVERVGLPEVGLVIKAKIDTGAKTSSLDADIIDIAKVEKTAQNRLGEKIVFSVTTEDKATKKTFERDIIRYVRIKKKGGGFVRRPVVRMSFCIATNIVTEEVNLANRENFLYPVLIGRNMMTHAGFIVNPSQSFITRPHCKSLKKD